MFIWKKLLKKRSKQEIKAQKDYERWLKDLKEIYGIKASQMPMPKKSESPRAYLS